LRGPSRPAARARPWLIILPALLLVGLFSVYPFLFALYAATRRWMLTRPDTPFIGLGNFGAVLASEQIRVAALKTVEVAALTVPATILLGLGTALLLNQRLPGFGLLRWIVLLPWAIPLVAAGVIWRLLVHGNFGALNGLLLQLGLVKSYVPFLSDPTLALFAV